MVRYETVLVIGAGASHEVNMPLGGELTEHIARLLDAQKKDDVLWAAVHQLCQGARTQMQAFKKAADRICAAMATEPSIDHFLEIHSDNEALVKLGKLAIARTILAAEGQSSLMLAPQANQLNYAPLRATWLPSFVNLLCEGCRPERLAARLSKIALVIFNYDRCVEHFIFYALQNIYGLSTQGAAEVMRNLTVFHPYGVVGCLPWQSTNVPTAGFGDESLKPLDGRLVSLADQLKTYSEEADSGQLRDIRRLIVSARIILFLGFAFHRSNMMLLKPSKEDHEGASASKRYYATATGLSKDSVNSVSRALGNLCSAAVETMEVRSDCRCVDLFQEYKFSLGLS